MLILDKRLAVEHMVALTAQHPAEDRLELPDELHGRRRQKIATFERRAAAASPAAAARTSAATRGAATRAGGISMA